MPLHPHPRSADARQRRAERRRLAKQRRLEEATAPATVEALSPSMRIDATFVAACPERIDRDRLASTTEMVQRAVEDLVEINRSNEPRGDGN